MNCTSLCFDILKCISDDTGSTPRSVSALVSRSLPYMAENTVTERRLEILSSIKDKVIHLHNSRVSPTMESPMESDSPCQEVSDPSHDVSGRNARQEMSTQKIDSVKSIQDTKEPTLINEIPDSVSGHVLEKNPLTEEEESRSRSMTPTDIPRRVCSLKGISRCREETEQIKCDTDRNSNKITRIHMDLPNKETSDFERTNRRSRGREDLRSNIDADKGTEDITSEKDARTRRFDNQKESQDTSRKSSWSRTVRSVTVHRGGYESYRGRGAKRGRGVNYSRSFVSADKRRIDRADRYQ